MASEYSDADQGIRPPRIDFQSGVFMFYFVVGMLEAALNDDGLRE